MKLQDYRIETGMGKVSRPNPLDFLSKTEKEEFDNIGYAGKTFSGKRISRVDYLNSLNKGEFKVIKTKWDDGTYIEEFLIIRVTMPEFNNAPEISKTNGMTHSITN